MDFGRHSYRPSLKREVNDKNIDERKSLAYVSISSKKFKGSLSTKDLAKYSSSETQKQVKEKIVNLLIKQKYVINNRVLKNSRHKDILTNIHYITNSFTMIKKYKNM